MIIKTGRYMTEKDRPHVNKQIINKKPEKANIVAKTFLYTIVGIVGIILFIKIVFPMIAAFMIVCGAYVAGEDVNRRRRRRRYWRY